MEQRIISLTLHRLNIDSVEPFRRFLVSHGCNWTSLPSWADGRYHICFPSETYCIKDEQCSSRTIELYTICLPDEYFVIWRKIRIPGTEKILNTIRIPEQD